MYNVTIKSLNKDENLTMADISVKNYKINNDFFYTNNMNLGINFSKIKTDLHIESVAVTTMKPLNENISITYNNVRNITY